MTSLFQHSILQNKKLYFVFIYRSISVVYTHLFQKIFLVFIFLLTRIGINSTGKTDWSADCFAGIGLLYVLTTFDVDILFFILKVKTRGPDAAFRGGSGTFSPV